MKGSKRPPEAEQRVPFIAAPRAGLTSKPVGNMSSDVGLQTLPQTWPGYPNYFDETTAVYGSRPYIIYAFHHILFTRRLYDSWSTC